MSRRCARRWRRFSGGRRTRRRRDPRTWHFNTFLHLFGTVPQQEAPRTFFARGFRLAACHALRLIFARSPLPHRAPRKVAATFNGLLILFHRPLNPLADPLLSTILRRAIEFFCFGRLADRRDLLHVRTHLCLLPGTQNFGWDHALAHLGHRDLEETFASYLRPTRFPTVNILGHTCETRRTSVRTA